jgi:hypothetical protein
MIYNIRTILQIRWKQMYRMLFQLGLFRLAVLILIVLFLFISVFSVCKQEQNAYMTVAVWAALILFIHKSRKDKTFLHINAGYHHLIYSIEYMLLSVPLTICLLANRQWMPFLLMLLGVSALGFTDFSMRQQSKTLNTGLQQKIHSGLYEWKAGVRKYFHSLSAVWIIGLCASYFMPSVPIAVFIIGLLLMELYTENESWQMLFSYEKNAAELLWYKMINHVLLFSILVLPLITAFMIFHSRLWYVPVIEYIVFLSIHIYCLLMKYAFYNHEQTPANRLFTSISSLLGLIPVFTPVLWMLSVYFYYKANSNLNFYLHDYD